MEFGNNLNQGLGLQGIGSSAQQLQAQSEHPAMGLFRKYVAAKQEFDDACHNYAQAQQRREQAAKSLENLSNAVAEAVQRGAQDPTIPQATSANKTPFIG